MLGQIVMAALAAVLGAIYRRVVPARYHGIIIFVVFGGAFFGLLILMVEQIWFPYAEPYLSFAHYCQEVGKR